MDQPEGVEPPVEEALTASEEVEPAAAVDEGDESALVEEEASPFGEGVLVETTDAAGVIHTEALEWTAPVLARVDDQDTIPNALLERVQRGPRRPLAEVKEPITGSWRTVSAGDFWQYLTKIAQGLIAKGLQFGDPVAIMSRTRYDWMVLDFASWAAGLVPVPIYETSSKAQIEYMLKDAGIKFVITESVVMANLVEAAAEDAGVDVTVLSMDQGAMAELESAGASVPASAVNARTNQLTLNSIATIVYTSGTTGTPKGAVMSHGNFTDLAKNSHLWMPEVADQPKSRMLLFLPLAHMLARFLQFYVVTGTGVIAHTPDIKMLLPDLQSFRPSFLLVVPRVLEKVYNSAEAKTGAGAKNTIFRWASRVAIDYSRALDTPEGPTRQQRAQRRLADTLVYSKLTSLLGGNIDIIISGGAPLSDRLAHFFRGAGLPVQEGYGLTETTGPLAVNTPHLTKIGTVGPTLPPMCTKVSDEGELLVKGPAVFQGYLNQPELTAEAFDEDGWFRTGDLGSIDKDGYLRITGRMKEVIVTAGGKNVIPSTLEDSLRGHPLISQVVVVGDQRPFIGALITLDEEMMQIWLKNKGLPPMSVSQAARHPEIRSSLSHAIERANEGVSRAESIRKFEILTTDFTEANGLMTPSMKVKRAKVLRRHAADIDAMYGGPVETD